MTPYSLALLLYAFGAFFVSLLIWLKRQDSVSFAYFLLSIFAAFWGTGFAILLSHGIDKQTALWAARFADGMAVFIPVAWYHFVLVYTKKFIEKQRVLFFLYVLSIVLGSVALSPWFIPDVRSLIGFEYYVYTGPLYFLFPMEFLVIVPLGFFELASKIKTSTGKEKLRAKGVAWSVLLAFLGGFLTFLPKYGISCPQYGIFLMPLWPILMSYFVMKENLFDLDKVAEAAHRDKLASIGILATSINHEVKNPLFIISGLAEGYLSKVKEGLLSDPKERLARAEEIFTKTIDQTYRAGEIIKRFAMFAKEGVKDEMKPEMLSVGQVLDDVLPLVRHELELSKIELIRDIPADLPRFTADRHHLTQILFNLIVNACQAMASPPSFPPPVKQGEAGGGRLTIRAESTAEGVQISIADTGPGMSEEQLREIFQPFRTTKAEGTGLGLYITKLLVEKNGGKISVESVIGKGTKFILELSAAQ